MLSIAKHHRDSTRVLHAPLQSQSLMTVLDTCPRNARVLCPSPLPPPDPYMPSRQGDGLGQGLYQEGGGRDETKMLPKCHGEGERGDRITFELWQKAVSKSSKQHLIKDAFFQGVLVGPQPRVSGGKPLLQAWRQLIQAYCKLGHIVPKSHSIGSSPGQQHADVMTPYKT